jgi:hypothetical protein
MRYGLDYGCFLASERQRLLREVSTQKWSWRLLGKLVRLNALVRMNAH